ncbi:hypothetical protein ACHHYP_17279 [Achlya hypogyna]|uniref:Transmembrane protein n=1 Tax=Achlya hypogyna TaxID=1202772 RepID=A0A1V9Y4S8_ACHHY|nr:hypothetical protein ACHHYP_17279 [Achlya hypogyna]
MQGRHGPENKRVAVLPAASAPPHIVPQERFHGLNRLVLVADFCVSVYSLVSFVTTSTLVDMLAMRQAVFMDDVANGVYDFAPVSPTDDFILGLMHNATAGQSKSVGYRDAALATPAGGNSNSWCIRVGLTLGAEYHAVYDADGVSRRYLRYVHTRLPPTCTGWTVAPGGSVNDPPIVAVDDARNGYGQSFLYCTDPRYYAPGLGERANRTSFLFRAGYIAAQQHFAGGSFGIETHISNCKAEKIGDSLYYKVSPYQAGDTRDDVNVLFSNKGWVLWLLDYIGQSIVFVILVQEVLRSSVQSITEIPTIPNSLYKATMDLILGRPLRATPTVLAGGYSLLGFSQIWLANPWYSIGNCMYALGTTGETQTLVETFYWQWSIAGRFTDFVQAAMYAMRHSWVSVCAWSLVRIAVTKLRLPLPRRVVHEIRLLEMYCSSRAIVAAFMIASFVATRTRGLWYLTDRVNALDMAAGISKQTFWSSEDMQSLLMSHVVGILVGGLIAYATRVLLDRICPGHRNNSFIVAVEEHRVCSGFDLAQLLTGSRSVRVGDRWVLLLPLADLYLIFSSVNLLSTTSMPSLPCADPNYAVEVATDASGTVFELRATSVVVPGLAELQKSARGYVYCAVV